MKIHTLTIPLIIAMFCITTISAYPSLFTPTDSRPFFEQYDYCPQPAQPKPEGKK